MNTTPPTGQAVAADSAVPATPLSMTTLRGPIEYALSGAGPEVLALHGAMGGYDQADLLGRTVLEAGFRVLAPSRPGYLGTSLDAGASPEEQADLYAVLLGRLGIRETAVVAISGGGPSAIAFALRHPDRCRGLVLISTCAGKIQTRLPLAFQLLKLMARWPVLMRILPRKAPRNLEQYLRRSISDPATLARTLQDPELTPLLEELMRSGFVQVAQRLAGTLNDVEITRTRDYPLEEIRVPVSVVHGTRDPFVPFAQHGKVLAERIPGAELLAIEGGEHAAIFTDRRLVRERVSRFLRALVTSPAAEA